MDHGCDVFTNIFTAFNLSRLLLVGNMDFFSCIVFLGLLTGFFVMTFEDYKLGEMHFPAINGADEGNFAVFLLGVGIGISGQEWLRMSVWEKYEFLTWGKLIGLGIALGAVPAVFNLYWHTFQKRGCSDMCRIFYENLNFYIVPVLPVVYIYYREEFWINCKWIVLVCVCLLFARITIDVQVKIATMDAPYGCGLITIIFNILLIVSFFITSTHYNYLYMLCLAIFQSFELASFIYFRANEITDHLGIKIFTIVPSEQI